MPKQMPHLPPARTPTAGTKWSDIARDKSLTNTTSNSQPVSQQSSSSVEQQQSGGKPSSPTTEHPNKPPALMSLKVEKPEPRPQMFDQGHNDHPRGGRGRGRADRRRDRRGDKGGLSDGRNHSMEFPTGGRRGRGRGT